MRNTTRTITSQRYGLLAVVAALALLAAACGEDNTDVAASDGVASIGDDTNSATSANTAGGNDSSDSSGELEAPENPEDAFELFNQCMEDAGFGGVFLAGAAGGGADASITISPGNLSSGLGEADPQQDGASFEDFDAEEFTAANESCEGHLASIDQDFHLSPEEQARFEDAQLEFSECMEDQGVEVPEFDGGTSFRGSGGSISIAPGDEVDIDPQTGRLSIDDLDFEAFNEAAEECNHVFEDLDAETAGG
jgi:hypothetical protein